MSITLVRKSQIRPLNIIRSDINTTTSGSALITKVIAGTGLTLSSSTGVNAGTGDVTIALSIASASVLGGVKIGSGLSIAVDGTISVSSITWGSITGTLSSQTDLQNALNAKYNNPTGTVSQYIDGTGAYQTFPTFLSSNQLSHEVKAGVAINKGQAVYVSSSDGTNMIVGLASNATEPTSSKTIGLLNATVSTNGFARVITEGLLAGLDTSGANAAGDPVWLGVNGALIYGLVNKPVAPAHLVFIGIVTRKNANNGEIFVKVQNGFEMKELHDYVENGVQNNYVIAYESSTSLYKPKSIATLLGYTAANDAGVVHTTGNETIAGIKTFSDTTQSTSVSSGAVVVNGGVGITKNLYVGGDINIAGNLTIGGTSTIVNAQNLSVSDNMIYLNNGIQTTITNVVGNGSTVVYTTLEAHNYSAGMVVTISGVSPVAYNLSNQAITVISTNSFTIANSATGGYISGGTARAKTSVNPDLGFAGGYNDGSYAHAGLFRDATDNTWKFFKGYTPEPDASPFIDTSHASFAYADLRAYNITGNSFIKVGGTSLQFLKADGSIDSNSYLTSYSETDTLNTVVGRAGSTNLTVTIESTISTYINTVAPANRSLTIYQGTTGTDAYLTFHISNDYAGYFGLGGAENDLVWGGWSVGNARHRIIHTGNYTSWVATAAQGSNADTAYSWGNHASVGYLTSVTNISGYSGTLLAQDNRTISPSELTAGQMKFGFTSWNNDNNSPYADFIHMRSYTDSSGGTDNLIMFKKSGIGMRIWQQTWGSSSPYAEYVDVWTTANFTQTNVTNWNTAYSWGNHSSQNYATQTYVATAISQIPTPSISIQQVNIAGTATESYTGISTLQFDEDSGFDVTNPSTGVAKVAMNSTFKYWKVDGVQKLTAVGLDTVNFLSGSGISITANGSASPQELTISSTDTLASVTARGATTSTTLNLDGRVNIGNNLTRPAALNSDAVAHARIGGSDVHLYVASLGAAGGYKIAVQAARYSDFQSFDLDLQSNGGTLLYGGNQVATRTWATSQFQPLENQRLSTTNSVTFVDIYANNWFRNNNTNTGLYNQANANHFYSRGGTQWAITSNGTTNGSLMFYRNHESVLEGQIYFDTDGFGLLNRNGAWAVRSDRDNTSVRLYYSGVEKFRTDSAGAIVTGRLDVTSYIYTPNVIIAKNIQGPYQSLNLDTPKEPGLYQYDGTIGGTQPAGTNWYNVKTIEIGSADRYSQFVMPYSNNRIFYRSQVGVNWLPYVELITSDNVNSFAATPTQGTQGATAYSWGNHAGLYLPLTGGTLSGAVIVNLGNVSSDTVAFKVGGPANYDSLTIGMEDTPDYDAFIASYGNDIRFYAGKNVGTEDHSFHWFTSKAGTSQHSQIAMRLDHNQNLSVSGNLTVGNRTILASGGVYDNQANGNNVGIGFASSALISTTGDGTYSAQNIGNATYPWYSATFVSSVTAATGLFSSTGVGVFNSQLTLNNTTSASALITFQNTINGFSFGFSSVGTGGQRFSFINGGLAEIAYITATGAATFSSSVTATSFGGSSYPYNSILGSGADASTSTVFAGSTNGYASSINVAGGGATNPNTIIFKTASVERLRINTNITDLTGSFNISEKLGVTGVASVGAKKLSMGILDLNTGVTPTQFKIKTNIPWNYGGSDFTVNIKGFRYGASQMVSLSIGWHYYNSEFYSRNAISNGAWSPIITLAKSPDGFVIIHLPSPEYWAKMYIESVYSSNSADSYTTGWSWTDADLSDCTLIQTVPYRDLATNITGNSGTTSQTNFSSLTINSAAVATQAWVQSQAYLTTYTDTLASVTGRGATTSTPIIVTASEGREVAVYMPSSYTTDDLVSGHEYGWYSDHWRLGMTRSSSAPGADFVVQWNGTRKLSLTNGGELSVTGGTSAQWNTAYSWGNHASSGYATTAYVTTQINNLIDAAPGALDTLNELAAALGDDPNFATTVTSSIAGKVSKAGDTITGKITFPSTVVNRPQFPGGMLGLDVGDGDFDIWGISRDYYPSHATLANAWGIRWNGTNNDFEFVGGGVNRVILDMDGGNLTISGTLTESSSLKLKENINTITGNLEKVLDLRPVAYNKIGSSIKELGLIAEEVAETYPEFVQYDENGEAIGVNYSRLTTVLIGAVKELSDKIKKLETK